MNSEIQALQSEISLCEKWLAQPCTPAAKRAVSARLIKARDEMAKELRHEKLRVAIATDTRKIVARIIAETPQTAIEMVKNKPLQDSRNPKLWSKNGERLK